MKLQNKIKVSLLQIEGLSLPSLNAILVKKYLLRTIKYKTDIIFTPECSNIISSDKNHIKKFATTQDECPVLQECKSFAEKYNKFISIGSLLLKKNNSKKLINRSFFINNKGKVVLHYDKIHLFDVNINKKEIHNESGTFQKGKKIVFCNSPWGKIGLTICYDLRFPNLYRKLAKLGCRIILVPSAFTIPTGKDHWEYLLRARAIENTSYVIATGQCGTHHFGRKTYGHSMVVDPWGKIISRAFTKPQILNTSCDLRLVDQLRKKLPSIYHD